MRSVNRTLDNGSSDPYASEAKVAKCLQGNREGEKIKFDGNDECADVRTALQSSTGSPATPTSVAEIKNLLQDSRGLTEAGQKLSTISKEKYQQAGANVLRATQQFAGKLDNWATAVGVSRSGQDGSITVNLGSTPDCKVSVPGSSPAESFGKAITAEQRFKIVENICKQGGDDTKGSEEPSNDAKQKFRQAKEELEKALWFFVVRNAGAVVQISGTTLTKWGEGYAAALNARADAIGATTQAYKDRSKELKNHGKQYSPDLNPDDAPTGTLEEELRKSGSSAPADPAAPAPAAPVAPPPSGSSRRMGPDDPTL